MATLRMPETEEAVQKLVRQWDLLLLMTGPEGTRDIDDDHLDRLLGYCLELGVSAVRLLPPARLQADYEPRMCTDEELAAVRTYAEAHFAAAHLSAVR
jgi:hypothetical protein